MGLADFLFGRPLASGEDSARRVGPAAGVPIFPALHIDSGEAADTLPKSWPDLAEAPARAAGLPPPCLVVVKSPHRMVVGPVLDHIRRLAREHPDRHVVVVLSELVERRWYQYLLHNQRAEVLTALLMLDGEDRIAVVNVPWYFKA